MEAARTDQVSMSQEISLDESEKKNEMDLYIINCTKSWKQIFPWLYYVEESKIFICLTCEWGSIDPTLIEIYRWKTWKDLKSVSSKLRKHSENADHKKLYRKREMLYKFCKNLYPLVKGFSQNTTCMEDVVKTLSAVGGSFQCPEDLTAKFAFTGFMIKRIAECLEEEFLNALSESPFFSILTHESDKYVIIRLLNKNGESEEHLFSGHVSYTNNENSCLTYLAMKNIDMHKMVSFSTFSKESETLRIYESPPVPQVPIRCPPLELLLLWVEEGSFLKDLFQQLTVITKLCKTYYHKFVAFPEAAELISIEEPFSHNCILNEKILNFFFDNLKVLKDIAGEIHKSTRNMDAYGFSAVELQDIDIVKRCAFLFPKMKVLFFCESQSSLKALENFKKNICATMREMNDTCSGEFTFLYILDIFMSHVLVSLMSPGKEITDVLSQSLSNINNKDVEILLSNLMKDYKGTNADCLNMLKCLCKNVSLTESCCILELTDALDKRPELHMKYLDLGILYKKIKVLPCYPAIVQQSMFNIAATQILLSGRMADHLQHAMTLITLEGPASDQIKIDKVIDMWARKWKLGPITKYKLTNLQELVYSI